MRVEIPILRDYGATDERRVRNGSCDRNLSPASEVIAIYSRIIRVTAYLCVAFGPISQWRTTYRETGK